MQTDDVLLVARKDKNRMLSELRIDSGGEFELESTNDGRAIGGGGDSERRGTNDSNVGTVQRHYKKISDPLEEITIIFWFLHTRR